MAPVAPRKSPKGRAVDAGTDPLELGFHEHTVGKWRRRFEKDRLDGLLDEPRPGRPRTIDDDHVAEVIERTLRSKPADATNWSIRPTDLWRLCLGVLLPEPKSDIPRPSPSPPSEFVPSFADYVFLEPGPMTRMWAVVVVALAVFLTGQSAFAEKSCPTT